MWIRRTRNIKSDDRAARKFRWIIVRNDGFADKLVLCRGIEELKELPRFLKPSDTSGKRLYAAFRVGCVAQGTLGGGLIGVHWFEHDLLRKDEASLERVAVACRRLVAEEHRRMPKQN